MIFANKINGHSSIQCLPFLFSILFLPFIGFGQYGGKQNMYTGYIAINDGLEQSRIILGNTSDKEYYNLTLKYQNAGDVFNTKFKLGMHIRDSSAQLISYINELKVLLIAKCENLNRAEIEAQDTLISLKFLKNYDDCITPTDILYGRPNSNQKSGPFSSMELTSKLNNFHQTIDSVFSNGTKPFSIISHLEYTTRYQWRNNGFKNKPLAAVLTLLSKLQLDIMLQELYVIDHLLRNEE